LTATIALLVSGAVGWAVASSVPPTYEASTRLLVGPVNADLDTLRASGALVQTYAELAISQPVLLEAIEGLGLGLDTLTLREDLATTPNEATRMLTIVARHPDRAIASALVEELSTSLREITGDRPVAGAVSVVDPTSVTLEPVDPDVALLTALAALAGLIAAVVMAVAVEYFGDSIQDAEQLGGEGLPDLFTAIPKTGRRLNGSTPIVSEALPASRSTEAYRVLSARILAAAGTGGKTVALFGSARSDGTGEVAANLAASLNRRGFAVSLIEANGDEPEATELLSILRRPTLAEFDLGSNAGSVARVHRIELNGLAADADFRLAETSGARVLNPRDVKNCIAGVRHGARDGLVIVSGPPILSSRATNWATAADIVLLVGLLHRTKLGELREAVDVLRLADAGADGLILLGGRTKLTGRSLPWFMRARSAS